MSERPYVTPRLGGEAWQWYSYAETLENELRNGKELRKAISEKVDALLKVDRYHERNNQLLDLLDEAVRHAYDEGSQFPRFHEAESIVRKSGRFNPPTAEDLTA